MKSFIKISGFLAGMLMATSAYATTITGPYIDGGAGADITQTQHNRISGSSSQVGHSTGFTGYLSGGWGFGNGLRVEVEGDYIQSGVNRVSPAKAHGHDQSYGGLVNVLYDIDLKKHFGIDVPVTPYFGVGAGYLEDTYNVHSSVRNITGTQGSFAYQGIVGAAFDTGIPGLQATVDYRMVGETMSKDSYHQMDSHFDNKFNHTFTVGIRYAFNNAPPPPTPTPTEIPAPAVARTYLVFFEWDKSDLTQQAKLIVGHAAQAVGSTATTNINVSGYTDNSMARVGSKTGEAYNMKLSIARANTVKAELVKDGVPANAIEVQGLGDNYQFVKTAPNTREALNRRVVITLR